MVLYMKVMWTVTLSSFVSRHVPKVAQIKVKDNETRIVVLREISTDKCLLVIYDQSVENENYTVRLMHE